MGGPSVQRPESFDDKTVEDTPITNSDGKESELVGGTTDDVKGAYDSEYPDGGLRAWLVVAGVSFMLKIFTKGHADSRRPLRPLFLRAPHLTCLLTLLADILFRRFGYVNAWGVSEFLRISTA